MAEESSTPPKKKVTVTGSGDFLFKLLHIVTLTSFSFLSGCVYILDINILDVPKWLWEMFCGDWSQLILLIVFSACIGLTTRMWRINDPYSMGELGCHALTVVVFLIAMLVHNWDMNCLLPSSWWDGIPFMFLPISCPCMYLGYFIHKMLPW